MEPRNGQRLRMTPAGLALWLIFGGLPLASASQVASTEPAGCISSRVTCQSPEAPGLAPPCSHLASIAGSSATPRNFSVSAAKLGADCGAPPACTMVTPDAPD